MDPFIGQIIIFGGTYAPQGWAFCQGQLLSISDYGSVFAVLGTTYGGDGQTNFALPDLRGRIPLGFGTGQGLSTYSEGQAAGSESVAIANVAQLPAHTHTFAGDAAQATSASPTGGNLATVSTQTGAAPNLYTTVAPTAPTQLASTTMANAGGGQGHANVQPYLATNYIIALEGTIPPRS